MTVYPISLIYPFPVKNQVPVKVAFIQKGTIQLSHMPHFNTRGAYFESLARGQNYCEKLVVYN